MVDSRAPGVIVVAERSLYDLLVDQAVDWRVQDRVESVAAMWDGLSSGALDPYSRVVVFSDSLGEDDPDELTQTAWAVAAMAGAGARVFVAVWQRERAETLDRQIVDAATAAPNLAVVGAGLGGNSLAGTIAVSRGVVAQLTS